MHVYTHVYAHVRTYTIALRINGFCTGSASLPHCTGTGWRLGPMMSLGACACVRICVHMGICIDTCAECECVQACPGAYNVSHRAHHRFVRLMCAYTCVQACAQTCRTDMSHRHVAHRGAMCHHCCWGLLSRLV